MSVWADTPLLVVLLAMLVDAAIGDPRWFYRYVPHPVVVVGKVTSGLDSLLNRPSIPAIARRLSGILTVCAVGALAWLTGALIVAWAAPLPYGWALIALLMSLLIAQNSLYRHVADVANALRDGGLDSGRSAVARIVGRDPDNLDEAGVSRAAIESTAENFSDGVVAPVMIAVLFGLPGMMLYKAVNTADSMIGHLNDEYRDFGWASARLDDVLNYVPARFAGLLIAAAAGLGTGAPKSALVTMFRDGRKHRSVNAGYPEAAMAGALQVALGGPRKYGGDSFDEPWLDGGPADCGEQAIRRGLRIYVVACALLAGVTGAAAVLEFGN